jgi:alkanesulfonate monooxygenase SsuD/methylene tetrahydromethanopterin reductase-like flavin-dependent oxidoreductase (luciferase family)
MAMLKTAVNVSGEGVIQEQFEERFLGTTTLPGEMLQNCISGTPDDCIKKIREFIALGVSDFSLWFLDYPSFDGVRLFADQVLPAFR